MISCESPRRLYSLLGNDPTSIWKILVKTPGQFESFFVERLFSPIDGQKFPQLKTGERTFLHAMSGSTNRVRAPVWQRN